MDKINIWLSWVIISIFTTTFLAFLVYSAIAFAFPKGENEYLGMAIGFYFVIYAVLILPSFLSIYLKDVIKPRPLVSLVLLIINFYIIVQSSPYFFEVWWYYLNHINQPEIPYS